MLLHYGGLGKGFKGWGLLHIGVPDFDKLLSKFRKFLDYDGFVDTFFGENMWGGENYIGHFGNHKWGYSRRSLITFIKKFGIDPIEVKTQSLNIIYTGRKVKNVSLEQMNELVIHSHNNQFGATRNSMTLADVRIKMNAFHKNLK